jgi:hypothetical protein
MSLNCPPCSKQAASVEAACRAKKLHSPFANQEYRRNKGDSQNMRYEARIAMLEDAHFSTVSRLKVGL